MTMLGDVVKRRKENTTETTIEKVFEKDKTV